jgi:flagellar hook protein FlgE
MSANMMYTAISGLNTFNEALGVVSNNIANANTTAYKSQTIDFGNLVSGYMPTVYDNNTTAQGVGSSILSTAANQNTGTEIQTNLWSDLMIQGGGYFEVQDPNSGTDYYTRDGAFQLSTDTTTGDAYLTDASGKEVIQNDGSSTIDISDPSQYASFSIDQYGVLTGTQISGGAQISLGTIGVNNINNPNALNSLGNNLYTPTTTSGAATTQTAGSGQAGTLISGALEGSNVDLTTQMVNMINFQADYQANSKSIVTANNMLQTVVNLISG